MNSPFESDAINAWLNQCPTSWNIEFNEEYGRLCIFLRDEKESEEDFKNNFAF